MPGGGRVVGRSGEGRGGTGVNVSMLATSTARFHSIVEQVGYSKECARANCLRSDEAWSEKAINEATKCVML